MPHEASRQLQVFIKQHESQSMPKTMNRMQPQQQQPNHYDRSAAMFGIEYATGNAMSSQAAALVASEVASGIEQMSYRDCSRITPADIQRDEGILPDAYASSSSPWSKEPPFPLKLHRILCDAKCSSAVVWLEHGRAWRIVDNKELERTVLKGHFKQSQISSFMRQVTGWGFRRVTSGRDEGAYYHDCFLRGLPHVCLKMKRILGKRSKFGRISVSPDFYAMNKRHPVPDENGNLPEGASSSEAFIASASVSVTPEEPPRQQQSAVSVSATPSSSGSSSVSQQQPSLTMTTNGVNFLPNLNGNVNVSLPQHLLAAAAQQQQQQAAPVGWLPPNPLLFQAMYGAGALGGACGINTLYGRAGGNLQQLQQQQQVFSQGINMNMGDLTAMNLQHLRSNNVAVAAVAAPQQQQQQQQPAPRPLQSLDLLSAACSTAASATAVTDYSTTGCSRSSSSRSSGSNRQSTTEAKEEEESRRSSTEIPEESKSSPQTEAKQPAQQQSDDATATTASPPRRAFMLQRKFQETGSGSSSSAGLNESGSDESSSSAQNTDDYSTAITRNNNKDDSAGNGNDGSVNSSTSSSSSVSMSEMGSDSGAQQQQQPATAGSNGSEEAAGAKEGDEGTSCLRRHFSSRRKSIDQTTSSMSSSELGSDGASATRQPAALGDSSAMLQKSDRSSSSTANSADSYESSLRKLWDLVSSADESSSASACRASHLVKTSKGLVDILIGNEENNGLESDASSPAAQASSVRKQEVGVSSDDKAEQEGSAAVSSGRSDKPSLDIAARAMTLGILWGMGRAAGTTPPATAVTNSGSSRNDSLSNAGDDFDVTSVLTNSSLHSSIAAALTRQKMQMQVGGSDERRPSSLSGSSDEGEKPLKKHKGKRHHRHESARAHTASGGKDESDERQKRSSAAAFGPPTEVTWGRKRKAPSAAGNVNGGEEPCAKRRARDVSHSKSSAPQSPGQSDKAKTVTASESTPPPRRRAGVIRSLSSLTTPLDDCSAIPTSKLTKGRLAEKNRLGASALLAHSIASSQPSDISGEDFETGSSQSWQSGSGSSKDEDPAAASSDGFISGSTTHAPGSSAESTSGDDRGSSAEERKSHGPAKKRKISSVGWHGVEQ